MSNFGLQLTENRVKMVSSKKEGGHNMKAEKKYVVAVYVTEFEDKEMEILFELNPRGSAKLAKEAWGHSLADCYANAKRAVMTKEQAEKVAEYVNALGGIYSEPRIITEKQLRARLARRMHVFVRFTTIRSSINRFGKLGINDLTESFYGSELDALKANKGLRYPFKIAGKIKKEDEAELKARAKRYPNDIAILQEITNCYYDYADRRDYRLIAR